MEFIGNFTLDWLRQIVPNCCFSPSDLNKGDPGHPHGNWGHCSPTPGQVYLLRQSITFHHSRTKSTPREKRFGRRKLCWRNNSLAWCWNLQHWLSETEGCQTRRNVGWYPGLSGVGSPWFDTKSSHRSPAARYRQT